MFYVYILYSEQFDRFYIGQTRDFQNRLQRHNNGYENATKPYVPWEMLLYLEKQTRTDAMELEKKLKNLSKDRIRVFIEKYRRC
jgi:putative endonuclease